MEETIAAIATPPGEGGIGVIRISGQDSFKILNTIFVPKNQQELENWKLIYGHIKDREKNIILDEVLAVYMKYPYTYTAEDVVEIQCHGSIIAIKNILSLIVRTGARIAEPGEFTKRAFLNGRLDLSQAEAVIDLIKAKTDKSFDVAFNQLDGVFSKKVQSIRKYLLDLLVNVAVNIDYPDEDIEEITNTKLCKDISQLNNMIEELLLTADTGRIIKEGLNVSIIGKPNVGKSSLMNALMKETRAIVTEIPGTTRDTIEEMISIKNIPVKLIDTAGIRETDDQIEKIGIEKSKQAFNNADLIIFMLDSSQVLSKEDKIIMEYIDESKVIVLLNKIDLAAKIEKKEVQHIFSNGSIIETSIAQGIGMEQLEEKIASMVYGGHVKQSDSLMVTNVRHKTLLEKALFSIKDAFQIASLGEALDFIEIDLKNAYEFLGEIIGETVSDDIINEVFSRFCLGK